MNETGNRSPHLKLDLSAISLALTLLFSIGCSNQISRKPATSSSPSPANQGAILNNPGAGDLFFVSTLSQAPNLNAVDIYSDPDTNLTQVCTTGSCQCKFRYFKKSDPNVILTHKVNASLVTELYVRCPYQGINPLPGYDRDVDHFLGIQVEHSGGRKTSDNRVFAFSGAFTPRNPLLKEVRRFQCRDIPTFAYEFDRVFYDPFRSDAVELAQPLNFFSTNLARSFRAFASNAGAGRPEAPTGDANAAPLGWRCQRSLQEPRYRVAGDYNDTLHSIVWETTDIRFGHFDYRVYSDGARSPLAGTTPPLHFHYPPVKRYFDHFSFALSKSNSSLGGVAFNWPVASRTYPRVGNNDSGPDTNGLIGFAAVPVRGACPTANVPGYRMVKLWAFRSRDIAIRKYPHSPELGNLNLPDSQTQGGQASRLAVGCIPTQDLAAFSSFQNGRPGTTQPALTILGNCSNALMSTSNITLETVNPGSTRAARMWMFDQVNGGQIIQNRFCSRTPANATTGSGHDIIQPMNRPRWVDNNRTPDGRPDFDRCHGEALFSQPDSRGDWDFNWASRFRLCPMTVPPSPYPSPYPEPSTVVPSLTASYAERPELAPQWRDYDEAGRQDYLFVVTDPAVTVNDLQSDPRYRFYRFASPAYCTPNPNTSPENQNLLSPGQTGTCGNRYRIYYEPHLGSIANPNEPTYPLCALQKEEVN